MLNELKEKISKPVSDEISRIHGTRVMMGIAKDRNLGVQTVVEARLNHLEEVLDCVIQYLDDNLPPSSTQ